MRIHPARRIAGTGLVPGDKSISHRAALIAALANGDSRLSNFSTSGDCASTVSCLSALGVSIKHDKDAVLIRGVSDTGFNASSEPLDCGNSGSTMRMLAGILSAQSFPSTLTGDQSLLTRPMNRIIEPLELMGARIRSNGGCAPLVIEGGTNLRGIRYTLPVASAQVKTCVLLAGLCGDGHTEVTDPSAITRDHTERLLKLFGAPIETRRDGPGQTTSIAGGAKFQGRAFSIPGDFSAAAYLIVAAALLPESDLIIKGLGLNPTRTQLPATLRSFGADIEIIEQEESYEPVGSVRVSGRELLRSSHQIDGEITAALIDELPLLAVMGSQLPGGLVIRDAAELRVKESDRIAATVVNLRAMGADVEEYDDGLAVNGRTRLKGARIDPLGDHRIAMAFSVAALLAEGESEILDPDCVNVSFPDFFDVLDSVVER
jgi:3-phosphoshikimate 1-carboxyvinyltransferase